LVNAYLPLVNSRRTGSSPSKTPLAPGEALLTPGHHRDDLEVDFK